MDIQTISIYVAICGLIAIPVALLGIWLRLRQSNRQQRLMIFISYTNRFREIVQTAPLEFLHFEKGPPPRIANAENLRTIRLYLDLYSEEFHLNKAGHVDEDVWVNWLDGMKFLLSQPSIQALLETVLSSSSHNGEFRLFVDHLRK
ncbi:hypothetical protein [Maritalea sp.]|uniref:hypothetical protein n=1 Tax=Maritalea sp. TaxID=2003361 RepID=UPI003F4ACCD3